MPVQSTHPSFEVPKEDIWAFLFERKDRAYPDNKGTAVSQLVVVVGKMHSLIVENNE